MSSRKYTNFAEFFAGDSNSATFGNDNWKIARGGRWPTLSASCAKGWQTSGELMAEFSITYRGTVYPWQCDHMGHMNVMWYTGKFDEATWPLLTSLGLTSSRFKSDGTGMAAVEQHLQYKRELHSGD